MTQILVVSFHKNLINILWSNFTRLCWTQPRTAIYRDQMFENMAQAQRLCSFGLDTLKQLFRMK
ncbi:hypothetical protein SD81_018310 [Tolypothrix campylonemoides VB511288]|nr:hypothetical protein SD81_018310 [Tolypothrix campylonemoides VB511288]